MTPRIGEEEAAGIGDPGLELARVPHSSKLAAAAAAPSAPALSEGMKPDDDDDK